jgi:nucleotide-binding universal stress UspA family protein
MKTILVLTDFSGRAEHAAEFAMDIAKKVNAEILLYHASYVPNVIPLGGGVFTYYDDDPIIVKQSKDHLEKLTERLTKNYIRNKGVRPPVIRARNEAGTIGENIREIISRENIWMVVMGDKSNDGALNRFFFGSTSYSVIEKALCPVLLVPESAELKLFKKIVFATELHSSEFQSMSYIEELAESLQSEITFLHVSPEQVTFKEKMDNYNQHKKVIKGLNHSNTSYVDVRGLDITYTLAQYAEKKADLLALVHKKRSVVGQLFHNSIGKEIMEYHNTPIMILPMV